MKYRFYHFLPCKSEGYAVHHLEKVTCLEDAWTYARNLYKARGWSVGECVARIPEIYHTLAFTAQPDGVRVVARSGMRILGGVCAHIGARGFNLVEPVNEDGR